MSWIILVIAGLFEIVWVVSLKYSEGFTKLIPAIITIAGMLASFGCLSYVLKTIPVGNAYAIWTGIGAVGITTVGIIWFDEVADLKRIGCIGLIVLGVVGLKVLGSGSNIA